METTMSEVDFKQSNGVRVKVLTTLLKEAQRAAQSCDTWLASGHIADYRTWQTQLRRVEEADEQYQNVRRKMGTEVRT
jgi:CCR4-NOT transcriptional regulation complex NOT5 subunit